MTAAATRLFPLLALALSALAYWAPEPFRPLKPAIVPLLGVVMFGMGLTLTGADFARVLRRPRVIALGVLLQYLLMPFFAWALARGLNLAPDLAAGLILVGSCPGGTASNVVSYLARADVALSITLTAAATLLAVVATPALTWAYAGRLVPVPVTSMLVSILAIVVVPVVIGVVLNALHLTVVERAKPALPLVSVAAIVAIIAIIVALNRDQIAGLAPMVAVAVVLHNLLGLAGGYGAARALGLTERAARTLAIEVGMQNSGLGVALAIKYFSPAAALPGALFSIWHNLTGAGLAGWWARRPVPVPAPAEADSA